MQTRNRWRKGLTFNDLTDTVKFNDADYVRDTPIGTTVVKYTRPDEMWGSITCDDSNYTVTSTATIVGGELVSGYSNVYKTGVDGLGIQFYGVAYGHSNTREAPYIYTAPSPALGTTDKGTPFKAAVKLIVTGPVKGGQIITLPTMKITYMQGPYPAQSHTVTVQAPISIVSKGCRLATESINVALPQGNINSLTTLGSTFGGKRFTIDLLDCSSDVKVYASFTDANSPTNISNILTPSSRSTAEGVGFRLTHNGNSINFGPDSSAPGTLNQFLITSNPATAFSIPMEASYIITGQEVKAGSLYGTVIMNMSYQ